MNEDDHKDMSIWADFFQDHVDYFSNAVIEQMIEDLCQEQEDRENADS